MSRIVRKQLFSTLSTLKKANKLLPMLFNGNEEQILELLTQCQSCAIEMGNQIDASYGGELESIRQLEAYCETVYQISLCINSESERVKLFQIASQQLVELDKLMEKELPNKLEAVFLPYKASMWDSLESVWKAADEDAECDAYVIPIPYYDKNPDGSFREEHYEGDLYPDYVPITKYDEYDLAERRPDMIFIHNPYDEGNFVTSVHPFYYAKNLKKYTEKLIYIPYFVLGEIDLNNKAAVEGMAHFCLTAGVINADKVIVQSENMRQAYIKVLLEEFGDSEARRQYWENKIKGLGSPKFDKVSNTKREELSIPEEWLRIIEKPDGSWKKIVFYNTSVNALLREGEQMLEKMERVFEYFKDKQGEIVLLWRPHPLIKATIESMRPKLWGNYQKMVEQYKKQKWGIYDDTVEIDRAIELCDAYYGDGSSVIQLCREVEKPTMRQNVKL